jgi:NAD(P)-dependent dehydrogenase (short-subunit alcohol dehydrogenase family)
MREGSADLLRLDGRVAVVTGGGRGIGAGIALCFAEAGASVVVDYRSSTQAAEDLVGEITAMGGKAVALQADVTRRDAIERMLEQTTAAFGRVDVLVNNAGSYPMANLVEMSEDDWDQVLRTNLRSAFLCTQAVARVMIEQGDGGAIVNVASIEAENPAPMHVHYCSAKAGVVMLTQASAAELGRHGIRVNCVSPGLIWREGIEDAWPDGVERWKAAAPLTRLGRPEDVANACLFFASDAARWITGANLRVDGGVMTHQVF